MTPLVSIIMGSTSDMKVMEQAAEFLNQMQIPFEINALSAHRVPDLVADFAKNYTTPQEIQTFFESRKLADQRTVDTVKQIIYYNNQTNSFENKEENRMKL